MDSPLTQLLRPDSFEPKIVQLYLHLFNVLANDDGDDVVPSEGFWREFFLLKPDKQRLYDILAPMTAFDLLQLQSQTQAFFNRAVMEARSGIAPGSENALENLTAFLCAVFTKKYTNPNTDVIEVLAGLDSIDRLMSDLVQTLESIIRQGDNETIRRSALHATLALVAGGFHTSLVSYFMHRDLFSALMKYIHDVQTNPADGLDAAVVIGILSSYNKFESQNVYHNRLADFVNEDSIKLLVDKFATACVEIRDQYVAVQDDYPASWSISNTLAMVGFRGLSSNAKKPLPPSEEDAKQLFASLPKENAACLLSLYSFVSANKLFAANLVNVRAHKDKETPLAAFLSSTSYPPIHQNPGGGLGPGETHMFGRFKDSGPVMSAKASASASDHFFKSSSSGNTGYLY
ncbi:DUF1741-domain-containing protein, partial [Aureobasidium melanogenum]